MNPWPFDNRATTTWLVNESGFYGLVMTSRLPASRPFQRWVTHEVLPAIRATGSYTSSAPAAAADAATLAEIVSAAVVAVPGWVDISLIVGLASEPDPRKKLAFSSSSSPPYTPRC